MMEAPLRLSNISSTPNSHEYSINQITGNFYPTPVWLNGLIRQMKMVGNGDGNLFSFLLYCAFLRRAPVRRRSDFL